MFHIDQHQRCYENFKAVILLYFIQAFVLIEVAKFTVGNAQVRFG